MDFFLKWNTLLFFGVSDIYEVRKCIRSSPLLPLEQVLFMGKLNFYAFNFMIKSVNTDYKTYKR